MLVWEIMAACSRLFLGNSRFVHSFLSSLVLSHKQQKHIKHGLPLILHTFLYHKYNLISKMMSIRCESRKEDFQANTQLQVNNMPTACSLIAAKSVLVALLFWLWGFFKGEDFSSQFHGDNIKWINVPLIHFQTRRITCCSFSLYLSSTLQKVSFSLCK